MDFLLPYMLSSGTIYKYLPEGPFKPLLTDVFPPDIERFHPFHCPVALRRETATLTRVKLLVPIDGIIPFPTYGMINRSLN